MNQVELSKSIEDQLAPTPGLERFPDVVWCLVGRFIKPNPDNMWSCYGSAKDALTDAIRPCDYWAWEGDPPFSLHLWELMGHAAQQGKAGVRLLDGDGNILAEWRVGR